MDHSNQKLTVIRIFVAIKQYVILWAGMILMLALPAQLYAGKSDLFNIYGDYSQYQLVIVHKDIGSEDIGYMTLTIQGKDNTILLRTEEHFLTRTAYIIDHHNQILTDALWIDDELRQGRIRHKRHTSPLGELLGNDTHHLNLFTNDAGLLQGVNQDNEHIFFDKPISMSYFFDARNIKNMRNIIDVFDLKPKNIQISEITKSFIIEDGRKRMTDYIEISRDMNIKLWYDETTQKLLQMQRDFGEYQLWYRLEE